MVKLDWFLYIESTGQLSSWNTGRLNQMLGIIREQRSTSGKMFHFIQTEGLQCLDWMSINKKSYRSNTCWYSTNCRQEFLNHKMPKFWGGKKCPLYQSDKFLKIPFDTYSKDALWHWNYPMTLSLDSEEKTRPLLMAFNTHHLGVK